MLLVCDDTVGTPRKLIFENILISSSYPDVWKLANVTPIFKKGDKQSINYRQISLLVISRKIFEKIIFNNLYSYLNVNNLITINQSGFRPGDSTTNQLLSLALVRPHLDYCDIIYHIPLKINPPQLSTFDSLMEKLERVQYQAALAVTGACTALIAQNLTVGMGNLIRSPLMSACFTNS